MRYSCVCQFIWLYLCLQLSTWPVASAAPGRSRIIRASDDRRIAGRYILRLDETADRSALYSLLQKVLHDNDDETRPELTAKILAVLEGAGAVSVEMSEHELERVRAMDSVVELLEDQVIRAAQWEYSTADTPQRPLPVPFADPTSWALTRITQRKIGDTTVKVAGAGANVDIYIADTGIDRNHPELVGRAQHFFTFYGTDSLDDNGHGTHAAGLAGGAIHGLAKESTLYAVKVLGPDGLGSITSLLAGMNEVYVARNRSRPAVLSMSVEGFQSTILDDMVERLYQDNVTVVVAAGNTEENACNQSPAHAPNAITVAATNQSDGIAWFSNFGPCVDLYAPGVGLQSAWLNNTYITLSGTSTACPLTAGAVAVYRGLYPSAPTSEVTWGVIQAATIDVVVMPASLTTPNRLLYAAFQCPTLAPPVAVAYTYTVTSVSTVTQMAPPYTVTATPPTQTITQTVTAQPTTVTVTQYVATTSTPVATGRAISSAGETVTNAKASHSPSEAKSD